MKPSVGIRIIAIASCLLSFSACSQSDLSAGQPHSQSIERIENSQTMANASSKTMTRNQMNITVGAMVFNATLNDSPSASAFKAMLPMTIRMTELNGKEKYHDFDHKLPIQAKNFATIQAGDLMMYGANTFVVFYTTFANTYAYTPLGRIDNPVGLPQALGIGDVTVKFDLAR